MIGEEYRAIEVFVTISEREFPKANTVKPKSAGLIVVKKAIASKSWTSSLEIMSKYDMV